MPSPTQAWTKLRTALLDTAPACAGDPRFTSETADPEPLIEICRGCPLLAPCRSVAQTGNNLPIFGVVGGLVRRGSKSTALVNPRAMERIVSG